MRNTIFGALAAGALLVGGIGGTIQSAFADGDGDGKRTYRVTVANATGGQPLAPGLIITHRRSFSLFQLNGEASHGLAVMAETGNPGDLVGEVSVAGMLAATNDAFYAVRGHRLQEEAASLFVRFSMTQEVNSTAS